MPKILAFARSLRSGSFNKKLVKIAVAGARAAGADVTETDLRDVAMPIFDEDLEAREGMPPGALGGLRGLVTVRSILGNIKVLVLPDHVAVPRAHDAFDADGSLKDKKQHAAIHRLGEQLARTVAKLSA